MQDTWFRKLDDIYFVYLAKTTHLGVYSVTQMIYRSEWKKGVNLRTYTFRTPNPDIWL